MIIITECHSLNVQTQVESSVEKTLCCWLCTSGPISITSRTDRRGYCPGKLCVLWCVRCWWITTLWKLFFFYTCFYSGLHDTLQQGKWQHIVYMQHDHIIWEYTVTFQTKSVKSGNINSYYSALNLSCLQIAQSSWEGEERKRAQNITGFVTLLWFLLGPLGASQSRKLVQDQ